MAIIEVLTHPAEDVKAQSEKDLLKFSEISINSIVGLPEETSQCKDDIALVVIPGKVPKDSPFAWVRCFSAFFIQVFIVGILHVFGIFFVALIDEFNQSKAMVAWVGSSCYGVTMALGPLASASVNRFGVRNTIAVGSLFCSISLITSSYVPAMGWLFLTFTIIYGLGMSLAYSPTMTIADDYFSRYLSIATGITVSGSSVGTLVLSPFTQFLVDTHGWRATMRILSALSAIGIICAFAFEGRAADTQTAAQRVKRSPLSRLVSELHLWKNKVYVVWVLAITCAMFGYYIPYVHLVSHALTLGIPASKGAILLMTLGASSAVGRIAFGKIITYGILDRLHMHQLSMVITGVACLIFPLIRTFVGLMVYVICVGFVDGCFIVMMPLLTITLAGVENKVLAWGYLVGVSSITFTLGPPTAGWIYDATGSYNMAFQVAAIPILIAPVIMLFIPWAQRTANTANDALSVAGDIDIIDVTTNLQGGDIGDGTSIMSAWAAPTRSTQRNTLHFSSNSLSCSLNQKYAASQNIDIKASRHADIDGHSIRIKRISDGVLPRLQSCTTNQQLLCADSLDNEGQYKTGPGPGRRRRTVSESADDRSMRSIQWSDRVGRICSPTAASDTSNIGSSNTGQVEILDSFGGIFNESFKCQSVRPYISNNASPVSSRTSPIPVSVNLSGSNTDQGRFSSLAGSPSTIDSDGTLEPSTLIVASPVWSNTLLPIPENKQLQDQPIGIMSKPDHKYGTNCQEPAPMCGSTNAYHSVEEQKQRIAGHKSPTLSSGLPDNNSETIFSIDVNDRNNNNVPLQK